MTKSYLFFKELTLVLFAIVFLTSCGTTNSKQNDEMKKKLDNMDLAIDKLKTSLNKLTDITEDLEKSNPECKEAFKKDTKHSKKCTNLFEKRIAEYYKAELKKEPLKKDLDYRIVAFEDVRCKTCSIINTELKKIGQDVNVRVDILKTQDFKNYVKSLPNISMDEFGIKIWIARFSNPKKVEEILTNKELPIFVYSKTSGLGMPTILKDIETPYYLKSKIYQQLKTMDDFGDVINVGILK